MFEPNLNSHNLLILEDGHVHIVDSNFHQMNFKYRSDEVEAIIKMVKMARDYVYVCDFIHYDAKEIYTPQNLYTIPKSFTYSKVKHIASLNIEGIEDFKGYSTRFEEILRLKPDKTHSGVSINKKVLENAELLVSTTEEMALNVFLKAEDIHPLMKYSHHTGFYSIIDGREIEITYRNFLRYITVYATDNKYYYYSPQYNYKKDSCDNIGEIVSIIKYIFKKSLMNI